MQNNQSNADLMELVSMYSNPRVRVPGDRLFKGVQISQDSPPPPAKFVRKVRKANLQIIPAQNITDDQDETNQIKSLNQHIVVPLQLSVEDYDQMLEFLTSKFDDQNQLMFETGKNTLQ
jgi:hypothetical protein